MPRVRQAIAGVSYEPTSRASRTTNEWPGVEGRFSGSPRFAAEDLNDLSRQQLKEETKHEYVRKVNKCILPYTYVCRHIYMYI